MYDFVLDQASRVHLLECHPIFEEKNYSFWRHEKKGCISVRSKNVPRLQELFLNQTSQKVLNLCNGGNSIKSIVGEISREYPDIPVDTIENDIINNVSVLSRYQLISWKERNPFMKILCENINETSTFELLDEGNIRELLKFIKEHSKELQFMNFMSRMEVYLDEVYIRDLLFNFSEDFFVIREKNEIAALISLKYHSNMNSTVCSIGIIMGIEKYIPQLLKGITTYSKETCNRRMSKIKIQILEKDRDKNSELITELMRQGFQQEGSTLKEYEGDNICNFSYYYQEEKTC